MKLKLPSLPRVRRAAFFKPRPKRLQATARRVAPAAMDDYDADEPTTRFSTAFVIVLILHVFAVGGIYVFKSMHHASRDSVPPAQASAPGAGPKAADTAGIVAPSLPAGAGASSASTTGTAPRVYRVKAGDTWPKVAALSSVTTAELTEFNGTKETAPLRAGQILNIPPARTAMKTIASDPHKAEAKKTDDASIKAATPSLIKIYVVKKGDNPVAIARTLNVSYDELLKLNKIEDPEKTTDRGRVESTRAQENHRRLNLRYDSERLSFHAWRIGRGDPTHPVCGCPAPRGHRRHLCL